jgi:hypothetical protein
VIASVLAVLGAVVVSGSSASPSPPPRRVAVLDLAASWSGECVAGAKLAQAQREQCEVLRLFADQARMGALAVLRPPAFVVMTRENTAQILKDMGGACSDGECEVETGGPRGAGVVGSGEVSLLEGTWIVSLKVHDVATAALVGGGKTKARTKLEAYENVQAETERMLRAAVGLEGAPPPVAREPVAAAAPPPPPPPTASDERTVVAAARPRSPWYVGLEAGALVTSGPGVAVPGDSGRFAKLELSGGYRRSPSWAFEALLGFVGSGDVVDDGAPGSPGRDVLARHAAVVAAWSPMGNRFFSAAAGVGLASLYTRVWIDDSGGGLHDQKTSGISPLLALQLRLDLPLDPFTLGVRLTSFNSIFVNGSSASSDLGQVSIEEGKIFSPVLVSLAAQYRFK